MATITPTKRKEPVVRAAASRVLVDPPAFACRSGARDFEQHQARARDDGGARRIKEPLEHIHPEHVRDGQLLFARQE